MLVEEKFLKWTLFSLALLDSFSLAGDGKPSVAFATSPLKRESPKGSLFYYIAFCDKNK